MMIIWIKTSPVALPAEAENEVEMREGRTEGSSPPTTLSFLKHLVPAQGSEGKGKRWPIGKA